MNDTATIEADPIEVPPPPGFDQADDVVTWKRAPTADEKLLGVVEVRVMQWGKQFMCCYMLPSGEIVTGLSQPKPTDFYSADRGLRFAQGNAAGRLMKQRAGGALS